MWIDMGAIPHVDIEGFALADGNGQKVGQSFGGFLGIRHDRPVARQPLFPLPGLTMGSIHLSVYNVLFKHSAIEDILITKQVLVVAQVMTITHID